MTTSLTQALLDRYRCPEHFLRVALAGSLSNDAGYFRFGPGIICFGQTSEGARANCPDQPLYNALNECVVGNGRISLSFNPTDVIDNLRLERYAVSDPGQGGVTKLAKAAYYSLRPFLPTKARMAVQRMYLSRWEHLAFPSWPVDRTVEHLCESLLALLIKSQNLESIPFIWFWPGGADSAAIMTHDVETTAGRDFCGSLMDLNDRFGIKSSFEVVPEERYEVTPKFLAEIQGRGFEIVVHDLNHDGRLFQSRSEFSTRVQKINSYGEQFGATGFRSAVLYRNQSWFDELKFSYDMSVPNVAHMDPQRGGCCTVFPYFIGDVLELPVTTTQDYSLFHMMNDYSTDLWKRQIDLIMKKHGLMSFIVHPDYLQTEQARTAYESLLTHLTELRDDHGVWLPTPGELSRWWRERSAMTLVEDDNGLHIEGPGKEQARIAFASERDGQLVVSVGPANAVVRA